MAACWARFQSDINEGLDQTDAQIFGKSKYKKVRDMAFIKYNPLCAARILYAYNPLCTASLALSNWRNPATADIG